MSKHYMISYIILIAVTNPGELCKGPLLPKSRISGTCLDSRSFHSQCLVWMSVSRDGAWYLNLYWTAQREFGLQSMWSVGCTTNFYPTSDRIIILVAAFLKQFWELNKLGLLRQCVCTLMCLNRVLQVAWPVSLASDLRALWCDYTNTGFWLCEALKSKEGWSGLRFLLPSTYLKPNIKPHIR